jgi:hypothetical protein
MTNQLRREVEALDWAEGLITDTLRVQREGCDHRGIGQPGCGTCDPRVFRWRDDLERFRAAILDRSTAAPGLDVERLTEALFQIHHVLPWRWWDGADVTGTSVEFAHEIARQYDRLAPAELSAES